MKRKRIFQSAFGAIVIGLLLFSGVRLAREMLGPGLPEGLIAASGRVEGDEVNVASKLAGRIDRLLVHEGDRVERGQLLARLGCPDLEARLAQAEAEQGRCLLALGSEGNPRPHTRVSSKNRLPLLDALLT